jgi:hypothetical protein
MNREFFEQVPPLARLLVAIVCLTLMWFAVPASVAAPEQPVRDDHATHEGMNISMDEPMDAAAQAKTQAKIQDDKKESEFNHHLAGFFLVIAGVFVLFQSNLVTRWRAVRYIWPACFLLAGIFVFARSDTELWPFGNRQWLEALQNNREVLQHKIFATLLVALGIIEWQKARGALNAVWSQWIFPAVAVMGSVLLIFHQHEGGMVGEQHMETMRRIQAEHMSYLMCGLGIGLSNGLSELRPRAAGIFRKIWPSLMILLGVLLMFYTE